MIFLAKTKSQRWHKINDLLKVRAHQALGRFHGKTVNVLVESQKDNRCLGRNEHFKTVQFEASRKLVGEIVPVKITNSQNWVLEGELV